MPRPKPSLLAAISTPLLALLLPLGACSSDPATSTTGSAGGAGGAGGATSSGGTGGATASCPEAATMLDVAKAPGAGDGYPKPTLSAECTADTFIVESNGMPHYTFVQITPNPLKEQPHQWEIPRNPAAAAQTSKIPLLGIVGFAVNGVPFYGPNEAAQPADQAYGDPIYNGIMDPCFGHTSPGEYHYHSMLVKCLDAASLVAKPWMNPDPPADQASPILAWSLDGYPIHGPLECADAGCAAVVEMKSGYAQTGNPKTNAWDAYTWKAHDGDATYLDECNGHSGPDGEYHYHATAGFPYLLGCYHGTPGGGGTGGMGSGGMGGGGPQSCMTEADCTGACPPGSLGCTCNDSPMGKICVPTCTTTADCPDGGGMTLTCNNGICMPQ
jgi:hypothetical protein